MNSLKWEKKQNKLEVSGNYGIAYSNILRVKLFIMDKLYANFLLVLVSHRKRKQWRKT